MIGGILEGGSVWLQRWAWVIVPVLLLVEYTIVFVLNPDYHRDIVDAESNVPERSQVFRSHALTLAGIAFTVVAILIALADNPGQFVDSLNILGTAIVLLFFSYEVKEVTETKKYWYTLQEKTLGYGFLSLFLGVVLLYDVAIPRSDPWLIFIGFIVVAGVRMSTVLRQMSMMRRMRQKGGP